MVGDKVRAIQEATTPINANEVSSFFGYINFYKGFLEKLIEVVAPLYLLIAMPHSTRVKTTKKVFKQ